MHLKKPLTDDGPLVDDLSYTVGGATENLYAALVVTLGYTNTFQRSDQWHNQARYEFQPGLICGFRRQDDDGETSYTLFYSQGLGEVVKKLAENRILPASAVTALLLVGVVAAFGQEEIPPNTWVAVDIDWKQSLAEVADDAQWQTGDGYSDNVLRTETGSC